MTSVIGLETIVVRAAGFLTSEIDDDLVMMSLERNTYYGLDDIGREIWRLLERPYTASELCEALLESYQVNRVRCTADVVKFLNELHEEGLVAIIPA